MLPFSSSWSIILLFSIVWHSQAIRVTKSNEKIITVNQGQLRGLQTTDMFFNFQFDSYLGIPFAKPPVANLTFKPPEPAENWSGIFNATTESNKCAQLKSWLGGKCYVGELDCLYLNVYVPHVDDSSNSPLAVMVWIYGGSFSSGSNNMENFGPEYLLEKNVIVVTINYRLGVYGFMGLNTTDYPGNAGFKDQRLALEWVYNNIAAFGGDPESITIFGESAGAVSVHFHLLSKNSRRYKRAIAESGSVLDSWGFTYDMRERTLKFAEKVNCSKPTDEEIVYCLQGRPVNELLNANNDIIVEMGLSNQTYIDLFFKPTSEPEETPDLFYSGNPDETINSGDFYQIPFLTGVNSAEAINIILLIWNKYQGINDNFTTIFPPRMVERIRDLGLNMDTISTNTKKFYFNNLPISPITLQNLVDCTSDIYFLEGAWTAFERMALANTSINNYFYVFSFYGLLSSPKVPLLGVAHADELPYLFFNDDIPSYLVSAASFEKMIINEMTTRWTNFAKTGNPGGSWQANSPPQSIKYYNIDRSVVLFPRMEGFLNSFGKRINFWKTQMNLP